MKFLNLCGGSAVKASALAVLFVGAAFAQDYSSMGITDVVGAADRYLQRGDYKSAIPALQEVVTRVAPLTDPQSMDTAQTCRFELARAHYQTGSIEAGMKVLEEYLQGQPLKKERAAIRMMAQGFYQVENWPRMEELSRRLLQLKDIDKEDVYNGNLLLGQACYRQEKWADAVEPLTIAAAAAKEERVQALCQIMIVRALVESQNWSALFGKLPTIYRTDSKYDINLNLTLMKAGKALYEEENYLNSLLLYRWVLPREKLLEFSATKVARLKKKLAADTKRGIPPDEIEERTAQITGIEESMTTLRELPAYEDEVTFRIGQIYSEVKRYWEGYVLFDELYRKDRSSEIGEAAMLQSVLILYDVQEIDRAEKRILQYLDERPDGQYARVLLSMMTRDNLVKENFEKVVGLRPYAESVAPTTDSDELALQADQHYMLAFGYFQSRDFKGAGEQFSVILDEFPESNPAADARYYRGMTHMMQGAYEPALADFRRYQADYEYGEHISSALFREAVCNFGLELIPEAEAAFSKFIEKFPNDALVSEAYSMRGDIEAAKPATNEDPHTLDRALSDYRNGINKAVLPQQASYAAFQGAKVYKLEFKWQDIIDLMKHYLNRWEEQADVAEATFWIGQAQIELGQTEEAVSAYLDAIARFGNDPQQMGVDKIIKELVSVADVHLSEEERDDLAVKLKLKLTHVDLREEVLRLRLEVAQALMKGEREAAAFGAELLQNEVDLALTTPASLALMCDAAVETGNAADMSRLADYFEAQYEESDLLWHAHRARAHKYQLEDDDWRVIETIDETQGMFGAEPHMGWAQMMMADTQFKMGKYEEAYEAYNMVLSVSEWRGPLFAQAMYGMGKCRMEEGREEDAHALFQRVYLLFKSYADGEWAAQAYVAAADALMKLGEDEKAINTLKAMIEDEYTNTHPLADQVREQLKQHGGA